MRGERMNQEKIVVGNEKDGPRRLIISVVLAFIVMLFINGFIGSMGGVPAFLAFLLMFYLTRTHVVEKLWPREKEQMEAERGSATAKKEVLRLFAFFSIGYLLIWSLLRVLMTISRVTGWGNLNGTSAMKFVQELLHTSLLEKSAYLAAGILMFAFVLSLFPLVVIKNRRSWALYALMDSAVFALLCLGIGLISSLASDNRTGARASCLIDRFLLCRELELWQELLALFLLLILMAGIGLGAYLYAVHCLQKSEREEVQKKISGEEKKKRLAGFTAAVCGIAAISVVLGIVFFMPEDEKKGYGKVAEFLTGDTVLGPMEYGGRVYVPVNEKPGLDETGEPQGYLAEKDENYSSRFYRLAVANVLYIDETCRTDRVQMKGREEGTFAPAGSVKGVDAANSVYVLWDEDWEKESAYSHEKTGYTVCNEGLMEGLTMQFPEVTYRPQDFREYDAYFTIRAYSSMDAVLENDAVSGQWAGCILVRDNKFYYGNYENEITGICLQQLREILGGNKK